MVPPPWGEIGKWCKFFLEGEAPKLLSSVHRVQSLLRAPQRFYVLWTLTEQWSFFTNGSGDLGIGGTGLRNMKQWVRGSWNPGDRTFGGDKVRD